MDKITVDPTKLYRPLQPYSSPEGTFGEAARLRGSEAPVQARPEMWILADSSDTEIPKTFIDRFNTKETAK